MTEPQNPPPTRPTKRRVLDSQLKPKVAKKKAARRILFVEITVEGQTYSVGLAALIRALAKAGAKKVAAPKKAVAKKALPKKAVAKKKVLPASGAQRQKRLN
jgi:hypothetical protein